MKVLVTGATGLVGRVVVAVFQKEEYRVHFLTTSKAKLNAIDGATGFLWNPAKGEIDLACFNEVTAVINLAGSSISKRWTRAYKEQIVSSRVNSIRTLKEGLQKIDSTAITSFISASGVGIYPHSLATLYKEDEIEVDASFLGDTVVEWEAAADTLNEFGFSVAKIRIGLVLSELGGALPKMAKPVQFGLGASFGSGNQWQSWIHIKDLANLFFFLTKHKKEGVFNGVAPNPITNAKLTSALGKCFKRPVFLPNIPKILPQLFLGEMAYLLFASQRVSSRKVEDIGFNFCFPSIAPALDDLYLQKTACDSDASVTLDKELA